MDNLILFTAASFVLIAALLGVGRQRYATSDPSKSTKFAWWQIGVTLLAAIVAYILWLTRVL